MIARVTKYEGVTVNGPAKDDKTKAFAAPHIVSVSVKGVRAEVLLHALEEKGIYVSAGSACASNKPAVSETLKAIHLPKELLDSTIRFSFGIYNTEEETAYAAETLGSLLETLRRFTRR